MDYKHYFQHAYVPGSNIVDFIDKTILLLEKRVAGDYEAVIYLGFNGTITNKVVPKKQLKFFLHYQLTKVSHNPFTINGICINRGACTEIKCVEVFTSKTIANGLYHETK